MSAANDGKRGTPLRFKVERQEKNKMEIIKVLVDIKPEDCHQCDFAVYGLDGEICGCILITDSTEQPNEKSCKLIEF